MANFEFAALHAECFRMWAVTAVRISKFFIVSLILDHQLMSYRKNLEKMLRVFGVEMNGLLALLAEKAKAR